MPTQIKVWEVSGKRIIPVTDDVSFASVHREAELEEWILSSPDLIEENLLVLAKQHDVPDVGRLDLLCMDSDGVLVIVELKRDKVPREAVAQALDYASWLNSTSEDEIRVIAREHLKCELDDAFRERFHTDPPEWNVHTHRILLVAVRLNAAAERIIRYLSEAWKLNFNAIFFRYSKLSDGKEILLRSVLVPDEIISRSPSGGRKFQPSEETLMSMAAEHGTTELVQICRKMREAWREQERATAGGSFRYWAEKPDGGQKMVFGVNVSGELAKAPQNELDVWVRTDALAEVTGIAEANIRDALVKIEKPFAAEKMDFILRLKALSDADRLVTRLQQLAMNKQIP